MVPPARSRVVRRPELPLRRSVPFTLLLGALVAACGEAPPEVAPAPAPATAAESAHPEVQPRDLVDALAQPPTFTGELPSLAAINIRDARIETVLSGLERPWAFAFIAEDEVLITETGGRLQRFRFGSAAPREVDGLPAIANTHPQQGLLDLVLHPAFAENRRIYFSYSQADVHAPTYTLTAMATARLGEDRLLDLEVLLEAGPYSWSPSNFGGAMAFDDQGMLYISIGDRGEHELSQRGDRLQGKILRLHDDGSVPADNPFAGNPDVDDRIYALGVRNPQGLDFDQQSGRLFEAEHGPLGGDEINIIRAGANYGWPLVSYGKSYDMADIGVGTHAPGMVQPIYYFQSSEAVSPLRVYRGAMFPEWDGDLLVGALRAQRVTRIDLDGEVVRSAHPILTELDARIRDLGVAADGSVFVLTEPGDLHRLYREPVATIAVNEAVDPAQIYALVCAGCHATGAYEAPNPQLVGAMDAARARPREEAYRRTIEGYGQMPARGLCDICEDSHLRGVVDFMLDQDREAPPGS
jgi:aldose sugar dehydrogenase